MTSSSARTIGYVEGRAAERIAILGDAAERGYDIVLMAARAPIFIGRCRLCGEAARGVYCAEHEWAYGEPLA